MASGTIGFVDSEKFVLSSKLKFPLIVKLLHEGSQIGLTYDSVVYNEEELRREIKNKLRVYNEPVIIEAYLEGREFTIPVIGNGSGVIVLPIIEIVFDNVPEGKPRINVFVPDDTIIGKLDKEKMREQNIQTSLNHTSVCPADVSKELEIRIKELALRAFNALECKDWCRLEIREDKEGNLYVIELNPIAGIDPSYFFPKSAKVYGLNYNELICKILDFALERYNSQ